MTFDANEWATEKSVGCQHVKTICAPCAMGLAQSSYDEGQAVRLERVRALLVAMRAERDTTSARLVLDAVLQALQ
jgi:hypothetical protein